VRRCALGEFVKNSPLGKYANFSTESSTTINTLLRRTNQSIFAAHVSGLGRFVIYGLFNDDSIMTNGYGPIIVNEQRHRHITYYALRPPTVWVHTNRLQFISHTVAFNILIKIKRTP